MRAVPPHARLVTLGSWTCKSHNLQLRLRIKVTVRYIPWVHSRDPRGVKASELWDPSETSMGYVPSTRMKVEISCTGNHNATHGTFSVSDNFQATGVYGRNTGRVVKQHVCMQFKDLTCCF